jgi:hypothetical protein
VQVLATGSPNSIKELVYSLHEHMSAIKNNDTSEAEYRVLVGDSPFPPTGIEHRSTHGHRTSFHPRASNIVVTARVNFAALLHCRIAQAGSPQHA